MSRESIAHGFDQLEQLYMMRMLHQTLRERLEEAQATIEGRVHQPPRMIMEIFRLPQQLEEMMLLRAIAMSLQQPQPSSAPPPISSGDADKLEMVALTKDVVRRLQREDYRECPICQEDFAALIGTNVSRLPCDHVFCVACIREWLSTSRTCPVCRLEVVDVEQQYGKPDTVMKRDHSILATPPPTPPVSSRKVPLRSAANPVPQNNSNASPVSDDEDDEGVAVVPAVSTTTRGVSHVRAPQTPPRAADVAAVGSASPSPFRREGVASLAAQPQSRVEIVGNEHRTPSPTSEADADSGDGNESDDGGYEAASPSHQALLEEIMQRRNETHQRTMISASLPPPPPPVVALSRALTNVPSPSTTTSDSRTSSSRNSNTPSRTPAVLTVGRPRATNVAPQQQQSRRTSSQAPALPPVRPAGGRQVVPNQTLASRAPNQSTAASVTSAASPATSTSTSVGVRGLLNRNRAPNRSVNQ